ncbi:uncharacterized protein CIMG_06732 [Coccidioides immitis RS]|uniref:MARVEL domain-containing protein n=4 Tax=Coccidioides immitis TaxID=5501 RepID=J3K8S7_COCIM|nr:uncharacterized protein CIMG_06732 [Coccidioides immitis RS]KMP03875.1 hypothetical protein CIRG_03566 [Coccidioides immitis RMSCC 2394]KMU74855.1 hypothetical protein CISG_00784 [Coccidioides immitis RMSCC 3703]KMU83388.1 hypothetical protein CIHG_01169 [Coccidioides immitis H538.4]TPX24092.1 hypothetical protein DIZ76_013435 [Coccidioides immitis]EAS31253.3 hypothetical protein CIMG_06732 [Coccidioides immitis RS]
MGLIKSLVIDGVKKRYSTGNIISTLFESCIRFLQFVFGIAVIGLYAQDVNHARRSGLPMNSVSKWIYATVIGSLSSITAIIYILLPCAAHRPLSSFRVLQLPCFAFDSLMFVLWLVVFGIFAKMYISKDYKKDADLKRMHHAVYVDLINLSFWMITAVWCGLRWWRGDRAAKQAEKNEQFAAEEGQMQQIH